MSKRGQLHLLGIGGSGMLPLALLLRQAGYRVTGSDTACPPECLMLLRAAGITAHTLADPAHLQGADSVVTSPAIPETHIERRAARRAGLPIQLRAQVLAQLIAGRQRICVAGSHGKSTTTAMLIHILQATGREDFGYMLGGGFSASDLPPARLGQEGAPFVTEACEAHGALHQWQPDYAILTNVDDDHADHYGGLQPLREAFAAMVLRLPAGARLVACGDDPGVAEVLAQTGHAALTYGLDPTNTLYARVVGPGQAEVIFNDQALGRLTLAVVGPHNLRNALAALGMALLLGVPFDTAAKGLARFHGVARRLQRIAPQSALRLFDDFAHHPAEIAASLTALREGQQGRLIAVLEPQLHSRVSKMAPAFAQALAHADYSFILPVAALGETAQGQDGNAALQNACFAEGLLARQVRDRVALLTQLREVYQAGDTLVVMAGPSGAGIAPWLAEAWDAPAVPLLAPSGSTPTASSAANTPPPFTASLATSASSPSVPFAAPSGSDLPPPLTSASDASTRIPPTLSLVLGEMQPFAPDLLQLIAQQAAKDPTAPAVEMGQRRLSYADLLLRAQDLAAALTTAGVQAGDSVGVCLGRSMDRVTSFLAILRLGAVFVPLDPSLPSQRLGYMLQTSGARVVIVNAASPALPQMGLGFVNCGLLPERRPCPQIKAAPPHHYPERLAYMIFTSGTTGRPKAVEVSRGAMANYALAAVEQFQITAGSRVSQISGFGFDVSVGDMVMALAAGACLVYPTDLLAIPGPPLGRFVAQAALTHLTLTPSALMTIPQAEYPALTHVIVAGETCPPALIELWGKTRSFINAYGPTEATIEVMASRCTPGLPVTLGQPFRNTGACVMDAALGLVERGKEGELCLFGLCLAKGYRHQPQLTASSFPLVQLPGLGLIRLYRTGDRVKCREDGQFIFLGRLDSQLKFKGYRIEPREIEAALCDQAGVIDASVSLLRMDDMPDRLIAHLVMAPGVASPDPAVLRERLLHHLPAYMVPQLFLPIAKIPLTANGKRDRSALPGPQAVAPTDRPREKGTATQARIMALIAANCPEQALPDLGDSLQDHGIDSLAMANLLFAIEEAFAITLDASFEAGLDSIAALALMVDAQLQLPPVLPSADLKEALAAKISPHLASWPGQALGPAAMLRHLGAAASPLPKLFWCFQGGGELSALTEALQGKVAVFGLRSGHLAVEYSPENLAAFARLYAEEISAAAPTGVLYLGGNCQGGMVMREVALELLRHGREVGLTILMEQGRFPPYPAPVLLLFGAQSYLNPYGKQDDPDQIFRSAYPAGHQVEMIPGGHGQYFTPVHVPALGAAILRHIHAQESRAQETWAVAPTAADMAAPPQSAAAVGLNPGRPIRATEANGAPIQPLLKAR